MPFVMRRVFHCTAGRMDELVELLQEGQILARGLGVAIRPRLLTDHNSGRTDRVAMEWEAATLAELSAVEQEIGVYPEASDAAHELFRRLNELVEYAEVETWAVHQGNAVGGLARLPFWFYNGCCGV